MLSHSTKENETFLSSDLIRLVGRCQCCHWSSFGWAEKTLFIDNWRAQQIQPCNHFSSFQWFIEIDWRRFRCQLCAIVPHCVFIKTLFMSLKNGILKLEEQGTGLTSLLEGKVPNSKVSDKLKMVLEKNVGYKTICRKAKLLQNMIITAKKKVIWRIFFIAQTSPEMNFKRQLKGPILYVCKAYFAYLLAINQTIELLPFHNTMNCIHFNLFWLLKKILNDSLQSIELSHATICLADNKTGGKTNKLLGHR